MKRALLGLIAIVVSLLSAGASAEDAFFRVPFDTLQITEGALPARNDAAPRRWLMNSVMMPYAVLDKQGEAYVIGVGEGDASGVPSRWTGRGDVLLVRAPAGDDVSGSLFLPTSDWSAMTAIRFSIAPEMRTPQARQDFLVGKEAHYTNLMLSGKPGTAWFRRQATEARRELGRSDPDGAPPLPALPRRADEFSETYGVFVGGQALSESLQLDRELTTARNSPNSSAEAAQTPVPVSSIDGITVQEMDFTTLLGDATPKLDALATLIPADQHAVFFASFDTLKALADETSERGLPVLRAAEQRSTDARLIERYERQLCLQRDATARLLGPAAVRSVAVTGSDPYFPTGTDVAVLFDAADVRALGDVLLAHVRAGANSVAGAQESSGEIEGVAFTGFTRPDRTICAYVARIGDAVVVTNSLEQLRRLAAVQRDLAPDIASLPEYRFFRARYPLGADGETGLVFLSDATIRRWCGPEWRIGASRRVRAGAVMADATAAHMGDLVRGLKDSISVDADTSVRTVGQLSIGPDGVRSSVFGSTAFLTPIVELGVTEVTPDEAASYKQWRDNYQRNWRWAFDPIAISFSVSARRLAADVTIMPLILASEYRPFVEFGRGSAVGPDAGDPHDTIAHAIVAVNPKSAGVAQASGMAQSMILGGEIDPLGWLGNSVAVYADPGAFWDAMLKADTGDAADRFLEDNYHQLPLALHAEVGSVLKLTAFLVGLRGFVDQTVPGMVAWEARTHNDRPYVRVALTEQAKADGAGSGFDKIALHYAAMPKALIISLSEDVLKRAMDRHAAPTAPQAAREVRPLPWLGTSLCAQFSRHGLAVMNRFLNGSRNRMQHASWANLPILNEWKRHFPDQDPARIHEARWGIRLVDPAGGQYVWNSEFKTMESTIYGHPGQPKPGPEGVELLHGITSLNTGVTFIDDGLRAKAVLERDDVQH